MKSSLLPLWIILYSICCCGILFGLLFSSIHFNLKNIYEKSIPILIALQIFFGGGVLYYKDFNLKKSRYTPVLADLMVSKWGYESLMVQQFKKNGYEKYIYGFDRPISHASFYNNHLIPKLQNIVDAIFENEISSDSLGHNLMILKNGINLILEDGKVFPFEFTDKLNIKDFSQDILSETNDYIAYLDLYYFNRYEELIIKKEERIYELRDSLTAETFDNLKRDNHNSQVENIVTGKNDEKTFIISDNKVIQRTDPIFQYPKSEFGRSLLFLPEKKLSGEIFDTFWFNTTVIWFFSLFLYVILILNSPEIINKIKLLKIFK